MDNSKRDNELEMLARFIDRHTYAETKIWLCVRPPAESGGIFVFSRATGAPGMAVALREFVLLMSASRMQTEVLMVTDGKQSRFEVIPTARPRVRLFLVDGEMPIVNVYQAGPSEAIRQWTRWKLKFGASIDCNPLADGPRTSYQPVFLPAGNFA